MVLVAFEYLFWLLFSVLINPMPFQSVISSRHPVTLNWPFIAFLDPLTHGCLLFLGAQGIEGLWCKTLRGFYIAGILWQNPHTPKRESRSFQSQTDRSNDGMLCWLFCPCFQVLSCPIHSLLFGDITSELIDCLSVINNITSTLIDCVPLPPVGFQESLILFCDFVCYLLQQALWLAAYPSLII